MNPDAEAGAVYDEEENVYTVTVNAYEDLAEVYRFTVTEVEGDIEDMAYNVGEKLEYEITVTVVADDEDPANLNVVALPNTAVDRNRNIPLRRGQVSERLPSRQEY